VLRRSNGTRRPDSVVIACANQKGGVGKTTTAVHLAAGLARLGRVVALIDLDEQVNAVLCLCPSFERESDAPRGWVRWRATESVAVYSQDAGAPGGQRTFDEPFRVRDEFRDETGAAYEVIILDCPPTLGPRTRAAIDSSDHVLIPLQCEFLALQGLARILASTDNGRSAKPDRVHIVPVMYEPDKRVHREIIAELDQHMPNRNPSLWIPRDPAIGEAASHGMSLFTYRPRSVAARAYTKLVREVENGWT